MCHCLLAAVRNNECLPNERGEHIRGDLKGMQPRRVMVNLRGGDVFVRFRFLE